MSNRQLSNLMLISNFVCTLFYAMSYPYVYAETVKAVTYRYLSFEQIVSCIGIAVFGIIWNKWGDMLFNHYRKIIMLEIIADTFLFVNVMITGNLKTYFVLNVIIYATITKNMACGGIKMRAKVNPDEKLRERYDNNSNTVYSISTLIGATVSMIFSFNLNVLFVFALIGNIIDNFFYLYIYNQIKER